MERTSAASKVGVGVPEFDVRLIDEWLDVDVELRGVDR
jgi:hypothetical protein